ncbi:toxin CcdB [Rhizobium sp. RU20A]|uniref:CcdB family protein n=1 Tax=Rhizobium sp. RU20A TaxID=1907412 RepID=UPI000953ECE1|nr:CcdB family protein [Rhizobium sp. RU20A]SIQ61426.1 toxin CcdB [Rhizobium sp. RU20A]
MRRFQVYRMGEDGTLALDLQSNLLGGLETRVVAPLVLAADVSKLVSRLNPRFTINGSVYVMMTEFLTAVHMREIGETVADLSGRADDIVAATDFLFQGF